MFNAHLTRRTALAGMAASAAGPALAKAPLLGDFRATAYRFGLGAFEVTMILDGSISRENPHEIFGADQDPETVKALAAENFLPTGEIVNDYTPAVVNTGNELILFDTGNGAPRRPTRGHLRERMAEAGINPEDIDIVVVTHNHPDHIGGMMEDGSPAFPNARYVTSRVEFDWWKANSEARGADYKALLDGTIFSVAEKATFLEDGQDVVSGVSMIAAHGHTPGHSVYHLESNGQRLLLCADLCNHYVLSLQRPEWHVRFDMDKEAGGQSRRRILDMIAAEKIPFSGYHMPFPALGYVEKAEGAFRYVPASYQLNL